MPFKPKASHSARLATCLLFALFFTGCIGAQPRFTPDIQRSFIDNPMRRMDTELLTVYYPAHRQAEAQQFAAKLEACSAEISKHRISDAKRGKIPVIMPEVEFNNAYVSMGSGGNPAHMLVPTFFTADLFSQLGMPPDPSFISCHEAVHFIQAAEISGVPSYLNLILGHTYTPQIGLDFWFWEGLATYYESRLNPGVGRMASPYWHQTLAAGFAGKDITSSALHTGNRQIPYGGQYLVGSHFIGFLAETYGEKKLWEIIDRQSDTIFVPFGVNIRFRNTYGKSLHDLIGEFSEHIKKTYPERSRNTDQRTIRNAGNSAQWAVAPNGIQAQITRSRDTHEQLTVLSADGRLLYERAFPDVLPPRKLILSNQYSGLSFTADSKHLYFTAITQGKTAEHTVLVHLNLQTLEFNIAADNLRGAGGDITPDGKRYIFPRADGNHHDLAFFDLKTRKIGILHTMPSQNFIVSPRVSPDGKTIVATVMQGPNSNIWLFSATTGQKLAEITNSTKTSKTAKPQVHRDPTWLDNNTLLISSEIDGRFQIVRHDLNTHQNTQISDAPYLAVQPFAIDANTIGFLNRDGWKWTIDTLPVTGSKFVEQPAPTPNETQQPQQLETLETPQLNVLKDKPYSQFDGVFIPRLHVPSFTWAETYKQLGLEIGGLDTLGFHSWSIGFGYEFVNSLPSFNVQYVNTQLAPWYLYFNASQDWVFNSYIVKQDPKDDPELFPEQIYRLDRRDRQFSANAFRQFYDIPLTFTILGTELYRPESSSFDSDRRKFLGAKANAQYAAARGSAYGGAQNLFALDLTAAAYPSQVGSDFSLGDLRAETTINLPLPFSNRHRLRINGRARSLLGTPDNVNLLRVGGIQPAAVLADNTRRHLELLSDVLPNGFGFSENLRGYEDYGFATNQLFAAEADYRYPFIIDAGTASTLGILPSIFLRQLNFELFANAATFDLDGKYHSAVGASIDLQVLFWLLPFEIRYQAAKRLVDDNALVHTLTLGIGL